MLDLFFGTCAGRHSLTVISSLHRVFNASMTKGKEACRQRYLLTEECFVVLCIQTYSTSAEQESGHIRPKIKDLYNVEAKVWPFPVHARAALLKTQRDESKTIKESAISNLLYYWCKYFRKRWESK